MPVKPDRTRNAILLIGYFESPLVISIIIISPFFQGSKYYCPVAGYYYEENKLRKKCIEATGNARFFLILNHCVKTNKKEKPGDVLLSPQHSVLERREGGGESRTECWEYHRRWRA